MFTKTDIEKYFTAEKNESLLFIIIGITAIVLAIVFFFFLKSSIYKGSAIPLILIGLIQLTVGYSVYSRADKQRIDNVYAFDLDPGKLKNKELPRMKKVNTNFVIYRWVEIALLLAGIALIFIMKNDPAKQLLLGLGISLAIQAALMLAADQVAEKRAKDYVNKLEAFINKH